MFIRGYILFGWWFQIFVIFIPICGEMIQFDEHILQMGWFNHHLVMAYIDDLKTASPFRTAGPGRRHSASGRLLFAAGCAAVWDAQEVEVHDLTATKMVVNCKGNPRLFQDFPGWCIF